MHIQISTFADLVRDGKSTIKTLIDGEVVRTLTPMGRCPPEDDHVHILCADGTELTVGADTPITYQPWMMDRGSLLFDNDKLKICTELDVLVFENGDEYTINHPEGL